MKLSPPSPIDTIVINACECEPFLTCDHRMMLERTSDLVEGAKLIARVVEAENIVFGVEINKPDAIEALEKESPEKIISPWSGWRSNTRRDRRSS